MKSRLAISRFLLVLLWLTCISIKADDPTPTIPVTQTWGDLLNTKVITVESDRLIFPNNNPNGPGATGTINVQVGIDRDHASSYDSVLLYCLVKGVTFSGDNHQMLGPFWINGHQPNAGYEGWPASTSNQHPPYGKSDYLLYTCSLTLHGPGEYEVELELPDKDPKLPAKLVAKTSLNVTGNPKLPWSPWSDSKKEAVRWQHGGNIPGMTPTYTTMTVCNPIGGIAVPGSGIRFIGDHLPAPETALPPLTTDAPDPSTQLKMEDNQLIVTTGHPFTIYFPDEIFLTRWWVNDKPYEPDPAPKDSDTRTTLRSLGARVWDVKEVHFDLDFRPERLGVHKGDKVGVQVLFCPDGFGGGNSLANHSIQPPDFLPSDPFSFPSNRIDFIYSGDPAHPQQK